MTENFPPIPPASQAPQSSPQYPAPQPEGYGQPQFQAPIQEAPPQYAAPGGYPGQPQAYGQHQAVYPPQGYAAPGPSAQPVPGPYNQQLSQWGPAVSKGPKSSGYRVASGIVGIALGTWLFVPSIAGFSAGGGTAFMAFLILVAALGNITAGLVLLSNQRSRSHGSPITSLSFAGFALLLGLIGLALPYFGAALFLTSLLLATPVFIVMGLGLSREKRGA